MKVNQLEQIESRDVEMPGAQGCRVQWLVDQADGAPNFAMRQFEVAPGGFTPCHRHPYEHEVYVLAGEGEVREGDRWHCLTPGTVVYVAPDELHQFRNTGSQPLKFLCMVPHAASRPAAPAPECGVETARGKS